MSSLFPAEVTMPCPSALSCHAQNTRRDAHICSSARQLSSFNGAGRITPANFATRDMGWRGKKMGTPRARRWKAGDRLRIVRKCVDSRNSFASFASFSLIHNRTEVLIIFNQPWIRLHFCEFFCIYSFFSECSLMCIIIFSLLSNILFLPFFST
jgi:hypothetical protein